MEHGGVGLISTEPLLCQVFPFLLSEEAVSRRAAGKKSIFDFCC